MKKATLSILWLFIRFSRCRKSDCRYFACSVAFIEPDWSSVVAFLSDSPSFYWEETKQELTKPLFYLGWPLFLWLG